MDFDINKAELVFEVRHYNNALRESCTYEYLYMNDDNTYFIHFVPGIRTDYIINNTYYSLFNGEEGFSCIDELVAYAFRKRNERKAKAEFEKCQVIDWDILRRCM